jgi:hypothetical protein
MKRISATFSFIVFAVAAMTQSSGAQEQRCGIATANQAIDHIVETWKAGYNSGEPEKIAALYAPEATYLTQHFVSGIVRGRAAIKAYVKKGTDAHYRIEDITVLASGCSSEFAYAITRYESTNARSYLINGLQANCSLFA